MAGGIVGSWLTLIAVQFGGYSFSLPGRGHATTTELKSTTAAPPETARAEPTLPKAIEAPKPAETTKPEQVASAKSQAETPLAARPANLTPNGKGTVLAAASSSTTGSDGSPELSATAMAAAATATPATSGAEKAADGSAAKAEVSVTAGTAVASTAPIAQSGSKIPTDPARSNDPSTKLEEAQAAPTGIDTAGDAVSPSTPDKASAPSSEATRADQVKTDPLPNNRIPADQIDREMAAAAHRTIPSLPQPQDQPKSQSEQASLGAAAQPQGQTTIELMRPFADQAGILTLAGRSVQLNGIVPTDVDRMCVGPSGKSWPCGQAARTAFRMYLRGRSIDCDVPDPAWKGTVKGECRYVRVDLSSWLVRFGWADPEPGSPLAALVDEAKEKKRGMYGDDPRKNGKSTLGPALPKEDPLNPI
ncbi:hypothetical protein RHSP_70849 [Rhizobium freirei PRF 81]|uniref:Uncharacterized protein n=1 Tax=Rhizobium freirei PRF 81 TaxID=363754 RepID=N6UYU2_9HYPH|nr:hypothetical protein RHSP_70849 [Rhizobium freirei PRF 81]